MDKWITSVILAALAAAIIACGTVGTTGAATRPGAGGDAYLTSDTTYGIGGASHADGAVGSATSATGSAMLEP